jgi:integrase
MSKQSKIKLKNERVKRHYFRWMQGAKGFSDKSIDSMEKALWKYEEATNESDYALFSDKKADEFKKYLQTQSNKRTGESLSLTSQYHHLRHVKNFFIWLSGQPGYKSKVSANDAQYLSLSQKDRRLATTSKEPKYPTLDQIRTLCEFPINDEIDMRDQALIAFTALTGMRDSAIVTTSLQCFDIQNLQVDQSPKLGVKTKFSKQIQTTIFQIDDKLVDIVVSWYKHLVSEKKYSLTDPLFPATELGQVSAQHIAFEVKGVSKHFWSNTGPMRKIFQERSKQTGMPYFSPHKFRHFLINEVQKHISSIEQLKALSQNMGHENMGTTFHGYGAISSGRVSEIVNTIDFSGKPTNKDQQAMIQRVTKQVMEQMQANDVS